MLGNVAGHLSVAKEDTKQKKTYEIFGEDDEERGKKFEESTQRLAPAPGSQASGSA
jgi:catalase